MPPFKELSVLNSMAYNPNYHRMEDIILCSTTLGDLSLPREPRVLGNATLYRFTSLNSSFLHKIIFL